MDRPLPLRAVWALLLLACTGGAFAQAPSPSPGLAPVDGEVIVRFKAGAGVLRNHPLAGRDSATTVREMMNRRAGAVGARIGRSVEAGQATGDRTQVMRVSGMDAATLARRLAADPDVEFAEPNGRKRIQAAPNDPLYAATAPGVRPNGPDSGQWYLRAPTPTVVSSIDIETAWLRTLGSASVVVAVLDTGVRFDHPDLGRAATGGRLLPGYDFVANDTVGNDGQPGRDADPSDPGDWVSSAEAGRGTFSGCSASSSSWHGTRTASLVGAATNNGLGMAGTAPGVSVLPVRVLGKCFGTDADIQAGMLWAAGISVPGVPDNPNPAKVLNMSLGASGVACSASYQSVVDQVLARGAVIVAAAGNSAGGPVGAPGNCRGVIAVLALRHAGTKVGFSDLGAEIAIAAPGGNCINTAPGTPCLYPISAASNSGTTMPVAADAFWTDSFRISVGTSFSSPLVAGTVGLMFSAQPTLTPAQVRSALQSSARPFPSSGADNGDDPLTVRRCDEPNRFPDTSRDLQCYCNTTLCGAGMLNAGAAVAAVSGPVARIDVTPAAPVAGTAVQLSAGGSSVASGRSVVAWNWTLVDGGGIATAFGSATNAATATITPSAAGSLVVRLTVTDDLGATASANQSITVTAPAPPPVVTPPAATGGGGGGAVTWPWMLLLALATAVLWRAPAGAVRAPARRA